MTQAVRVLLACAVLWATQAAPAAAGARADVACVVAATSGGASVSGSKPVALAAAASRCAANCLHSATARPLAAARSGRDATSTVHSAHVFAAAALAAEPARVERALLASRRFESRPTARTRRTRIYLDHCVLQR